MSTFFKAYNMFFRFVISKIGLSLCCISFLFSSCMDSSTPPPTQEANFQHRVYIDTRSNSEKTSSFKLANIEVINLQNVDSAKTLSSIQKIDFSKNRIYAFGYTDNYGVFVFTPNGSFINKYYIKEESEKNVMVLDSRFNQSSNTIEILYSDENSNHRLCILDSLGKKLKTIRVPEVHKFIPFQDKIAGYLSFTPTQLVKSKTGYRLMFFDKSFSDIEGAFLPYRKAFKKEAMIPFDCFSTNDDQTFFYESFNDTIYEIANQKLKYRALVKFDSSTARTNANINVINDKEPKHITRYMATNKIPRIYSYIESNNTISICYISYPENSGPGILSWALYRKANKATVNSNRKIEFKWEQESIPIDIGSSPISVYHNRFVSVITDRNNVFANAISGSNSKENKLLDMHKTSGPKIILYEII